MLIETIQLILTLTSTVVSFMQTPVEIYQIPMTVIKVFNYTSNVQLRVKFKRANAWWSQSSPAVLHMDYAINRNRRNVNTPDLKVKAISYVMLHLQYS